MIASMIRELEKAGLNTSWYYRSKANNPDHDEAARPELVKPTKCGRLSAHFLEPTGETVTVHTVTSSGEPYKLVKTIPNQTKLTESCLWCSSCRKRFRTWEGFNRHLVQSEGKEADNAKSKV